MKNNKNGFTLIEMLVVIGIIAILGVTIGVSSNTLVKNSKKNEYKSLMTELFNAASIYYELSEVKSSCTNPCPIKVSDLVNKGLINKNIYGKNNPMFAKDTKFVENSTIFVSKASGVKEVTYICSTNFSYNLQFSKIEDYTWGKC